MPHLTVFSPLLPVCFTVRAMGKKSKKRAEALNEAAELQEPSVHSEPMAASRRPDARIRNTSTKKTHNEVEENSALSERK